MILKTDYTENHNETTDDSFKRSTKMKFTDY